MTESDSTPSKIDLRAIIARLREIERKCASMSSRSEEFPAMREKVADIIARLEAGQERSGDPLDFRRIGRELFPVTHLFESTGFMSVGKEIAHIERSLTDLAPKSEPSAEPASRKRSAGPRLSSAAVGAVEEKPEAEPEGDAPHRVPVPVFVGLLVLALVAAGSAAIIFRVGPFARKEVASDPQPATATPVPAVPTPRPDPGSHAVPTAPPTPSPTAIAYGRLSEEVAAARLALIKGDLETANTHLSEAARIDRTDDDVVEIAGQVVNGLVSWASGAAENADWDRAGSLLQQAERVAMRFGVSTASIEHTRARIATMERYVVVGPGDRETILRSTGRRVEVLLVDGNTRTGRIEGLEGGELVLNMDSEVGGGVVRFSERLALSSLRSLKIFEN